MMMMFLLFFLCLCAITCDRNCSPPVLTDHWVPLTVFTMSCSGYKSRHWPSSSIHASEPSGLLTRTYTSESESARLSAGTRSEPCALLPRIQEASVHSLCRGGVGTEESRGESFSYERPHVFSSSESPGGRAVSAGRYGSPEPVSPAAPTPGGLDVPAGNIAVSSAKCSLSRGVRRPSRLAKGGG